MTQQQEELRRRGICVVIPTYNNAGTIVDVVSRTLEQCADVFVVCDGCTDGTDNLLKPFAGRIRLIQLSGNRGKGIALRKGIHAAANHGFAYAITLDADGQHYPEDIPCLLEANRQHPDAVIVGERRDLDRMPRSGSSRFANRFSNFWFFVQTGIRLKDTQCGYRLYPLLRIPSFAWITARYEAELELLVLSAWRGTPVVNVPLRVFYPEPQERVSHFRPVRDFARITLLNIVLCVLALVYGLPRYLLRQLLVFFRSFFPLLIFALASLLLFTPGVWLYLHIGGATPQKRERLRAFICHLSRWGLDHFPGIDYYQSNPSGEDFSRPAIIICNHQSHLDLLPLLGLTPRTVMLTADWVWKFPLYGYIIRNAGFLPVSRGLESLMPELEQCVAQGCHLMIFPEGTRSADTRIGRYHQGAFYLAQQLQMDIVPVTLYGTGHAMPKHSLRLKKWTVHMEVGRRITPQELREMGTFREQAAALREYTRTRYEHFADTIEQTLK